MSLALFSALIGVVGLACDVAVQIAWVRLSTGSRLRSVYAGFLAGAAAVCVAQAAAGPRSEPGVLAGDLAANLVIYAFLGYGYFHFFNLGETGRRVRLVRELYGAPEGLTLEELLSRYDSRQIVAVRLARLLGSRQIILEDGRYRLGRPTMARISGVIVFLKKAILGRSSEFESGDAK
jgi:hypothetical protein